MGGGADRPEDEFGVTEGVLHVGQRLWPRHRVEPPELVGDASRIGLERSSVALEQIGESQLKTIPNLKLVVFDPLQAFTTGNISSSNEVGQLWGSYCANISARLGVTTLTVHHLAKSALTNDSDDALSHRAEIRGASSITDSVRFAIAMWLADNDTCEKICMEQGIPVDRMAVVKASLVKSNSGNVDYATKTLVRRGAVLEILENNKSFDWD